MAENEDTGSSIKDALQSALTEHEEPEAPAADDGDEATQEASEAEETAAEEAPVEESDDKSDEEPAKEAASSEDAPESAGSEKAGEDATDQDDADEVTPEDEAPPVDLLPNLSAAHLETLQALPRDAQEFLAARHKEMEADYTRKSMETADFRKTAENFNTVVEPYRAYIASFGVTPEQAFSHLMGRFHRLQNGTPEQKTEILAQLAKDNGVSLQDLADETEDDPVDPHFARVEQRIGGLERTITQQNQAAAQQDHQAAETQIKTFVEAKDAGGNPLYPHFEEVRASMGDLVNANPGLDLETAYQNAVWANPELRQQELAKEREAADVDLKAKQEATAKKAALQKSEKVKRAKKAAKSVTTQSAPVGTPAAAESSLRDEISSNWDQASSP